MSGSVADVRRQEERQRRNLARVATANWASQGQRWGRCKVRRRVRAGEPPWKRSARGVLVVRICSPRPRAPSSGQVVGDHLPVSVGPLRHAQDGGEAARGEMVEPARRLEARMAFRSRRGCDGRLEIQAFPPSRGDEAVRAEGGREGQLVGTGIVVHMRRIVSRFDRRGRARALDGV